MLVLGILLTIEGPWSFDQLWIVIGLVGMAATFAIGIGVIEPTTKKMHAAIEGLKPTADDVGALVIPALVLAAVGLHLVRVYRADVTEAAATTS